MAGLILVSALAGCGRGQVKVYQLANDNNSAPSSSPNSATAASRQSENNTGQPKLHWTLPEGWTQVAPGDMSIATFKVQSQNNAEAEVSVVPLPGPAGGQDANVNRWRRQIGLPEATPDEVEKMAETVQAGDQTAKLYDIAGQGSNTKRILGVIQERSGMTWFFKMMGDASLVEQQKPSFLAFLKSLTFAAASQSASLPPGHPSISDGDMNAPMMSSGGASAVKPDWTVPADWRSVPPAQFLLAQFSVAGANGTEAEVNVAELNGSGGGVLANVNRWRGQIGLEPVAEDGLAKLTTTMQVTGGQATFVDMNGSNANNQPVRLVAAVVPMGNRTWFYKLMGDEKVVASQKDAFTKFVQTARYSNAP